MNRDQAIARIKELCAKRKKTQLSEAEAAELKELQGAYPPKKGKGERKRDNDYRKPGNDFSFWNNYPELMDAVTRVPWNYIPGTPVHFRDNTVSFKNVMRIQYIPTIGISRSATDPFNLQFRDLFLQMHRKYRGLGKYQQADLAIVVLCIASIYVAIAEAERIYGVYHAYPVNNRITPRGILKALGYSDDILNSIEVNLSDFRSSINRLIIKASRLVLPHEFNALRSWISLSAFLYADSQDKRASVIAFRSGCFYKFSGTAISTGSAAIQSDYEGYVEEKVTSKNLTESYQTLIDFIDDMLEALLSDDDVSIMCSDLLAAFGEKNLEILSPLTEDYVIKPVYSESILFKVHNMEWMDSGVVNYFEADSDIADSFSQYIDNIPTVRPAYARAARVPFIVCQSNNVVLFNLVRVSSNSSIDDANQAKYTEVGTNKRYAVYIEPGEGVGDAMVDFRDHTLDTWKEKPGIEDVCEGVLWKVVPEYRLWQEDGQTTAKATTVISQLGTELITSVRVSAVVDSDVSNEYFISHVTTNANMAYQMYCHMSKFDWAPVVIKYTVTHEQGLPATWAIEDIISDVDNFTTVDDVTIRKILDTALLSAFAFKIAASGE